MTYVLPPTPEAVARQVDHYEWTKKHFPHLYATEVEIAEWRVLDAFPSASEVAILRLPPYTMARVHHLSGVREYRPSLPEDGVFAVVPGDKDTIGWGAVPCWYYDVRGIRNGRHQRDRAAWHDAAALLRLVPIVYIAYEQLDWYGKQRWTAVDAGVAPLAAARLAEKAGADA